MEKQKTVKGKISFEGIGLHTGKKTKLELLPSPPNSGIFFVRQDVASSIIKADFYSVLDPEEFPRRTSIGTDGIYVHTIEHIMAALSLFMLDNVQIHIWGEEVPGLDGSAKDFVEKIKEVGIEEQEAARNYLVVKEPLWVDDASSSIVLMPCPHLRISYGLKYDNSVIDSSYMDVTINGELINNFYEARTFCLEDEVKILLDMGLGKGANYENTLVISQDGIIKNKLRFPDEFVKHKVLDLIGDLYLIGPLKAHVIAIKSGHFLNIKLLEKLRKYKEKSMSGGILASFTPTQTEINTAQIMKMLPHRYPFLLVDKITHLEKGKRIVGIKNLTINEHFFQGHFPSRPIMPGVLIIEAMAQVGGVLMLSEEQNRGKLAYFMAADKVKFRRTVEPGDKLTIEVVLGKLRSKTGIVSAKAYVEDKLVAEAELMFALMS